MFYWPARCSLRLSMASERPINEVLTNKSSSTAGFARNLSPSFIRIWNPMIELQAMRPSLPSTFSVPSTRTQTEQSTSGELLSC